MTSKLITGVGHETLFWQNFVKTDRFMNNWVSDSPNPELEPEVRDIVRNYSGPVLDVGSGPVSILRGSVEAERLKASDLLADVYALMFDYKKAGIEPPAAIAAEDIVKHYGEGVFDVVHMRNALDHCQDPSTVLFNLVLLARRGGVVIIHGFENEATSEKYQGFHQWNVSGENNGLNIYDEKGTIYCRYNGKYWTKKLPSGKTWFFFTIEKR